MLPEQWRKGKIIGLREAYELNQDIDDLIYGFKSYYRKCKRERRSFVVAQMFESVHQVDEIDFIQFCKDLVRDHAEDYALSTLKKRDDIIRRIEGFRAQVYMSDIDYQFLVDLRLWLKTQKSRMDTQLSDNYIASILVVLRYFVNEARRRKLILSDPFVGFKIKRTAKVIEVHNEVELSMIENVDLSGKKYYYEVVRDRYLWMCYTGMRFSDMGEIGRENVDKKMLKYIARKTRKSKGKTGRVPFHLFDNKAYLLFEKYGFNWGPYSNRDFNVRIKDIMRFAKIDKHVTAHTARHSFKSILLERGYPIYIISEMMAHSSIRTTEDYGSVSDQAVLRKY